VSLSGDTDRAQPLESLKLSKGFFANYPESEVKSQKAAKTAPAAAASFPLR